MNKDAEASLYGPCITAVKAAVDIVLAVVANFRLVTSVVFEALLKAMTWRMLIAASLRTKHNEVAWLSVHH